VGAEGHMDLFVFKLRGDRIQFYCRTCTMLWLRIHVGGTYSWTACTEELDAVTVPGCGHGKS
jgi:hypothetical protein